ncbi:MAG: hypothetical protein PVF91_00940, partial [Chromatiales bacterium]
LELPPRAVHLARSRLDPNQAFRVGDRAWGLQFHPEFNEHILTRYIAYHRGLAPGSAEPGVAGASESPHGPRILRRFASLAGLRTVGPREEGDRPGPTEHAGGGRPGDDHGGVGPGRRR